MPKKIVVGSSQEQKIHPKRGAYFFGNNKKSPLLNLMTCIADNASDMTEDRIQNAKNNPIPDDKTDEVLDILKEVLPVKAFMVFRLGFGLDCERHSDKEIAEELERANLKTDINLDVKKRALGKLLDDSEAIEKLFKLVPIVPNTNSRENHEINESLADQTTDLLRKNRELNSKNLLLLDQITELNAALKEEKKKNRSLENRVDFLESGGKHQKYFESASEDLFLKLSEVDDKYNEAIKNAKNEFDRSMREAERSLNEALKNVNEEHKRNLSEVYEEFLKKFSKPGTVSQNTSFKTS